MGTTTVANLTAVISANNTKFKKGVNGAKSSLGGFQKSINAIGPAIAAAFSVNAIKRFAKESLELADKQAKAEKSLLTALDGRVFAQSKLIQQAKELQSITLFGDEETIAAQSMIAAFVQEEEQIRKLIPLIQDFAVAKGMGLVQAADLVTKTFASSTNALSRYGIEVEGAALSAERLDDITNALSTSFKGQAEAAAEADKIFTQLKNTFGDYKESVAAFATQGGREGLGGLIRKRLESEIGVLEAFTDRDFKQALGQIEKQMTDAFGEGALSNIEALNFGIDVLTTVIQKNQNTWTKAGKENAEIARRVREALEAEKVAIEAVNSETETLTDTLEAVNAPALDFNKTLDMLQVNLEGTRFDFAGLNQELLDLALTWSDLDEEIGTVQISENMQKEMEEMEMAAKKMSDTLTVAFARIGSGFAESLGEVAAGSQTLAETLKDISTQIIGALGDILILTGLSTSPVGVPLILAGLALKGFGSFIQASQSTETAGVNIGNTENRFGRGAKTNFTIRGNDLVTAYDDSETLNQRLY